MARLNEYHEWMLVDILPDGTCCWRCAKCGKTKRTKEKPTHTEVS